jgi:hypothetical protein
VTPRTAALALGAGLAALAGLWAAPTAEARRDRIVAGDVIKAVRFL